MLNAPGDLLEQLVYAHQHRWTHTDELLALLLQKLDQLYLFTVRAWADPKKLPHNMPPPFEYRRPHAVAEPERPATVEEIRAFFAR